MFHPSHKSKFYSQIFQCNKSMSQFLVLGPSGSNTVVAESRASSSRSPGKSVIVRAVSHSTYLGDFFLSKFYPKLQLDLLFINLQN